MSKSTLRERIATCMRRKPEATQAEIARKAGVKPPSVTDWINGETHSLRAEPARRLADYFGCDQNWLASGVGLPRWREPAPGDDQEAQEPPGIRPALQVVIESLASLSSGQWAMVQARLNALAMNPGDAAAAVRDLTPLLARPAPATADDKPSTQNRSADLGKRAGAG